MQNAYYDSSTNEVTFIPSKGTTDQPDFYVTSFSDTQHQVQDPQLNTILLHDVTATQAVILFAGLLTLKTLAEE